MTVRADILRAARLLASGRADGSFSPAEVVAVLREWGSPYAESSIRTHIISRLCADAPPHHATRYGDFVRVGRGRYTFAGTSTTEPT